MITKELDVDSKRKLVNVLLENRVLINDESFIKVNDMCDYFKLDPISLDPDDEYPEIELSTADALTFIERLDVEQKYLNDNWYVAIEWLLQYFGIKR
jgi:hypothetical protein